MEYPKALFLVGWDDTSQCVIVSDKQEEEAKRSEGYSSLNDTKEEKPKRKKAE